MKKIIFITILVVIVVGGILAFTFLDNKKDSDLTTVKVAEVTHSMFYAPQYAAISQGFFEEEGLEIDLVLTAGANNVAAAVLSGDVQIGFCGPEATIYVYDNGEEDYLQTFAGLTNKDGSFLVSREKIDNFTLDDLKGKYVVGGRKGGMPEMTFEWVLRENGIDPKNDLTIDTSIDFAAMSGAFIGGTGDFVTLFEPTASQVEKEGYGYVVTSVGALGGEVPYTAYNARKSFIENNPELIQSFTNAINKGLKFVNENDAETVAKAIHEFFPDDSLEDVTDAVKRYKEFDAWKLDPTIKEEEFERLKSIMIDAGELPNDSRGSFDKLFTNEFAEKVK